MKASDFVKHKGKAGGKNKKMGNALMDWIGKKNQGAKAEAAGKSNGKK